MPAPIARKVPTERTFHGHTYVDDYEWMRDKESAELIELLKAETHGWVELAQTLDRIISNDTIYSH